MTECATLVPTLCKNVEKNQNFWTSWCLCVNAKRWLYVNKSRWRLFLVMCILNRGERCNIALRILISNRFQLHFIKSFNSLGRNFWCFCRSFLHIQCTFVFQVGCVWLFQHHLEFCAWTCQQLTLGFVLFCWGQSNIFIYLYRSVCQELNILSEVLTHGCLWSRRGCRWTWMKMYGAGGQREWRAVGG